MPSQVSTPTNPASLTKRAFVESSRRRRADSAAESAAQQQQQQQQSVDVLFGPEHDWTSDKAAATTNSRELNHNGKQYRIEAPDKLVLVASPKRRSEQLDNEDFDGDSWGEAPNVRRADSYKCLAINIVGQQASEPLEAQHNCESLSSFLSGSRRSMAVRWPLIWANQSKPTN